MYLLFSAFMLSDFLMLNIGKYLGKKIFPGDIKNIEIIQQNFMGLYHHIFSGGLLSYMIYTNFNEWPLSYDGSVLHTKKNQVYNSVDKNLYTIIIVFEISYYIVSILNKLFLKINKRVDAKIEYVHHLVTLVLIYIGTIHPAGEFCTIYILFTHNLCDIPIKIYYIGKKLNEALFIFKNKMYKTLYNYSVGIFTILLWAYLRLYMYGSLTFAIVYVYPEESNLITKACLCIIYIFNIIWFYMCINCMITEVIKKNEKSILYDK